MAAQLSVYCHLLPGLLKQLAKIPEPRQATKVKHRLTVVWVYGLLMGVLQMASRREANARAVNIQGVLTCGVEEV